VNAPKESLPDSRRLLHINHPAAILRLVERFCESKKFSIDSFESASAGFHHALTRKYRLIVLGLPAKGLDPARVLKGLLRAKVSTPVLLMAEFHSKEKLELAKYPNVIATITKPLDVHEFSRYLDSANKPPELDPKEKQKLIEVLRRWEGKIPNAA
jgi:DNA-binding NtrC family response regulator